MSSGPDDEEAVILAALSARYGAQLEEKVAALGAAVERARQGEAQALEEAYALAHKLHGTAGSYGFGAVSTVARRLEALLRPVREGKAPADWSALGTVLRELVSMAAAARPPGGG